MRAETTSVELRFSVSNGATNVETATPSTGMTARSGSLRLVPKAAASDKRSAARPTPDEVVMTTFALSRAEPPSRATTSKV
jgi:hypothetical protein